MKMSYLSAFALGGLLIPFVTAFAQYSDRRGRNIDSLEQVVKTGSLKGVELAQTYLSLAWGYSELDAGKKREYSRKGIAVAEQLNEPEILADLYNNLAISYYYVSQHDTALVYYEKALEMVNRMANDKRYDRASVDIMWAMVHGDIGNMYNIQGKDHLALSYYFKALSVYEKLPHEKYAAITYGNMGDCYLGMKNYEQAEFYFLKKEALAREFNDSSFLLDALAHLGSVYSYKKDYTKALESTETANRIAFAYSEASIGNKMWTLQCLSDVWSEDYHDYNKALQYAQEALQYAEQLNEPLYISLILQMIASNHLNQGKYAEAERTAFKALETDSSYLYNNISLYEYIAKANIMMGNKTKAMEYFDRYTKLNANYSNKNYQSSITEMEVHYETEKKEMRISALESEKLLVFWLGIAGVAVLLLALAVLFYRHRLNIHKRHIAEQQVKQLEQEKQLIATQSVLDGETAERTRLARDLHDGLGSMLTGIKLNLNNMYKGATLEAADVELFSKALGMLDTSIRELRRVAHHLMPDALTRYGLKTALTDFCESIPNTEFGYFGNDERLDSKLEVMIYRVIHELVNNALKHSGATHILVQIVQEDDRLSLTVEDNGCGFNPSDETKGTGLANIRARVASFNGTIDVNALQDGGTGINVELIIDNTR